MTNRQDNLKFCETRHTFPCLNLQNIKTYNKIVLRIKTHTYTHTRIASSRRWVWSEERKDNDRQPSVTHSYRKKHMGFKKGTCNKRKKVNRLQSAQMWWILTVPRITAHAGHKGNEQAGWPKAAHKKDMDTCYWKVPISYVSERLVLWEQKWVKTLTNVFL